MCLSGDIYNLNDAQWGIVRDSIAFYRKAAPIIRDGQSRRVGTPVVSYRHPEGWQALVRYGDNSQILAVVSTFAGVAGGSFAFGGFDGYQITASFVRPGVQVQLVDGTIQVSGAEDFEGLSVILGKQAV